MEWYPVFRGYEIRDDALTGVYFYSGVF